MAHRLWSAILIGRNRHSVAIGYLALSLFSSVARAEWLEVSSDHFVIYANQDEVELTRFAERLEKFHAAMALHFKVERAKPSPSNRVTIFVVSSRKKVRQVGDFDNRYVAGFYRPRAGGTVAVIPKLQRSGSKFDLTPEKILYHEYAHHFMYGVTARVFPRWFTEGFAEFYGTVKFEPDGSVGLGAAANDRVPELMYAKHVPISTLLTFDGGAGSSKYGDSFYGQSWILFHYLMFAPERTDQLSQYQTLLGAGKPALDAAKGAFGDLDKLADDVDRYVTRGRISYFRVSGAALDIRPISVRALRPGEAAMLPTRIESRVGVSRDEALELLPEARAVAAQYPNDPAVLAALSEAEVDAGNNDEAIAAADRAIAINGDEIDAQIRKGYALFNKAKEAASSRDAWQEARRQFIRANKVENDNPVPLYMFYRTYTEQGEEPTKNAVDGLEWAMMLAPFDSSVRWTVAQQMIHDNRLKDAAETLAPLAYSPHPGDFTDQALKLLKDVEARIVSSQDSTSE